MKIELFPKKLKQFGYFLMPAGPYNLGLSDVGRSDTGLSDVGLSDVRFF